MNSTKLTAIVPRLPPAIDGLGDYGLALARKMKRDFGVDTEFIVADPFWNGPDNIDSFLVRKISARTSESLLTLLPVSEKATVLLHYVGYGYAKRGCPFWLMEALKEWKQGSHRTITTMFHELYAFGPIWTSQFWTSPFQRYLVKEFSAMSASFVTSRSSYAKILEEYTRKEKVPVIPVFSNVGEPSTLLPLKDRARKLVIFGNKIAKDRAYTSSLIEIENICNKLSLDEILDVGPASDFAPEFIGSHKVVRRGSLPSSEVSEILSGTMVGFINYPLSYLGKSGIFAAYTSHRMLVFAASYPEQIDDSAKAGVHYLSASGDYSTDMESLQKTADNAHTWYQGHSLSKHAELFFKLISSDKI